MALYHKHRPQLFSTIIGQDHIRETLMNQVRLGKVAHAYLFSGPRGVGKTTTARVLAKAVNCRSRQTDQIEPCDACDSCQSISQSRAMEVIEIDAASNTGVDNVREHIIDTVNFQPSQSPYKIFIIDEVHMLSTSAFNALLKTLEEPPAHVIFILATTELHKLPDTIISRCQRFSFKKIPADTLKQHLDLIAEAEGVHISAEVMQKIIRVSAGCARDAVNLLDQLAATGEKHITPETASLILPTGHIEDVRVFLDGLKARDETASLRAIHTVSDTGLNLSQFAHDLIECLRIALIKSVTNDALSASVGLDVSPDDTKALADFGKTVGKQKLVELIDLALKRRAEIKSAPIPELPLELLAVEWCNDQISDVGDQKSDIDSAQVKNQNPIETKKTDPPKEPDTRAMGEEKKTILERVKELVTPEHLITVEQAQTAWQECTKKLETLSPSLVFILKMAEIQRVEGTALRITVPYQFHKDKLEDKPCRRKIEGILQELLNTSIQLDIGVKESAGTESDIEEMAALLGGEVVNA
ncbi:MAG: DNA polymerase III subunit gamma/tau [Patescibacteria group bacterium]